MKNSHVCLSINDLIWEYMLPLENIRIIDMCNVVMGPYATQILAEYGADVIKIEPPEGDDSRRTGFSIEKNMASLFMGVNRGKKSVTMDLKDPAVKEDFYALVRSADIFVHNIRPQKLKALGIAPDDLRSRHPNLIYVSLNGFGQDGPYGGKPAYDDVIQGMSGIAALSQRHGADEPRYTPTILADKTVGTLAASAILAAVVKRERFGVGSFVEVPMFESMVAFTLVEHMYGASFPGQGQEMGYPRALAPWRKPFATMDGHICVMPYTDRHWQELLVKTGHADMAADPRFSSISARSEHSGFVYQTLGSLLSKRTTAEWLALLEELQVPGAVVNQPEDLLTDPHLQAVGFFQHMDDASMGPLCFPGAPVLFDGVRAHNGPPPRLGEHTREVMDGLSHPLN